LIPIFAYLVPTMLLAAVLGALFRKKELGIKAALQLLEEEEAAASKDGAAGEVASAGDATSADDAASAGSATADDAVAPPVQKAASDS
jgi:hypothetical protein